MGYTLALGEGATGRVCGSLGKVVMGVAGRVLWVGRGWEMGEGGGSDVSAVFWGGVRQSGGVWSGGLADPGGRVFQEFLRDFAKKYKYPWGTKHEEMKG